MRRIAIFKPGTHTSSQGMTATYSEEECQRRVALYNEQPAEERHDAPIVIGHPKENSPAFGWVSNLEYADGHIWAVPRDVPEEFEGWVQQGLYRKVSPSFYPDGKLRHVGFLGGTPPAIKGLPEFAFAEAAGETFEFADERVGTINGLLRRIRDYLIQEKGLDEAEKILPAEELDRLNTDPWDESKFLREEQARLFERVNALAEDVRRLQGDTIPTATNPLFSETPMSEKTSATGEKPAAENGPPADFAEQLKTRDDRIATLESERQADRDRIAKLEAANRDAEFREFLGSDELKGRVTPGNRDLAMVMLRSAAGIEGEVSFSEGEETRTGSALDAAKAQIKAWPKLVDFNEVATKDRAAGAAAATKSSFELGERDGFDPERREMANKAQKLAKEKSISFNEALDIIISGGE